MKKGDFHLHTNASDGKLTPTELIDMALNHGLDVISITDHDTTLGLDEGLEQGLLKGIKVIPGIELSTLHNGESIHLLGYFMDDTYKNPEFQGFLKEMHDYRIWRGKKFAENLYEYFNINIDINKLIEDTKGVIARPHIAQAIISSGYPYNYEYIFQNIISKDSPAYVKNKDISLEEGIYLLKKVHALVVLAHPVLIKNTPIEDFMNYDIDGLEAYYPLNSEEATNKFVEISLKRNKLITAGSDFHGLNSSDSLHGTIGDVSLRDTALKNFINKYNTTSMTYK